MLSERKEEERKFRQHLILDGAHKIFKEQGIDKATMDEIGNASRFGTATLYYYFSSKEEVFAAILKKGWKTLWENIEDSIHSKEEAEVKFLDTLYQIAGTAIKHPNLYRFLFTAPKTYPNIADKNGEWKQYKSRLYSTLQELLRDGIKGGAFPNVKPELLMKGIGGIFHGILFMGNESKAISKKDFKKLINELLHI